MLALNESAIARRYSVDVEILAPLSEISVRHLELASLGIREWTTLCGMIGADPRVVSAVPRLHWILALGIALASRGAYADDFHYDEYAAESLRKAEQLLAQGDYLACIQELSPVTWQASRITDDDVDERIDATLASCRAHDDEEQRWLAADRCKIKITGAITAIAAPRAMAPKSARRACLALMPSSSAPKACPRVELVWKTARRIERRAVAAADGGLVDNLWCCRLDSLGVGRRDGAIWVRVGGTGHPCGGGTAYESSSTLYRWDGKALTAPVDQTIEYH